MTAAQALYRDLGFQVVPPFAHSVIPEEHRKHFIYMQRAV